MNIEAIFHRAINPYCYALNENDIEIRLQTAKDVKHVSVFFNDPFVGKTVNNEWITKPAEEAKATIKYELENHYIWSVVVTPPFKRLTYYFQITDDIETIYYLEEGLKDKDYVTNNPRIRKFNMPWINPNDVIHTPKWVANTRWYQIFPDRFCNKNQTLDEGWFTPWNSKKDVSNEEFYGGDIAGIISKLDYIKNLGINGLYLTPILQACTSHRYDTTDYFKIDPRLGDEASFIKLVEEARKRNIKVMIDLVFNHSGSSFAPWQDVLNNGEKSKYKDWFFINKFEHLATKEGAESGNYFTFAFTENMPKLNTNNVEVQNYLLKAVDYYVNTLKVDGLRLDVANEVSSSFWRRMRFEVDSINNDIYILGEVWNDSIGWLNGDMFHSVMNYPLTTAITRFFGDKSTTGLDFMYEVNNCYALYSNNIQNVLFNLLDSHDTPRLINQIDDLDSFFQELVVLFTLKGSPSIFYGTEIVLPGEHDPSCRKCMPWDEIERGEFDEQIKLVSSIIKFRENLKFNSFIWHTNDTRVINYDVDNYKVVVNASSQNFEITGASVLSRKYRNGSIEPGGFAIFKK